MTINISITHGDDVLLDATVDDDNYWEVKTSNDEEEIMELVTILDKCAMVVEHHADTDDISLIH